MAPGLSLAIGVAYLAVGLAGGQTTFAWTGFAIMVVFAVALVVSGRYSETAKGLLDHRDERINAHDRDAALLAGGAVIVAVIVMFCIEIARGHDGSPYYQLGALGGLVYLGALLWQRWRR